MRHFLEVMDLNVDELSEVLKVGFALRDERNAGKKHQPVMERKSLAMIFEKPSLRTRVSFELAVHELGGYCLPIRPDEVGLGKRESPADVARVLSGMTHGIIARVFEHEKLSEMAEFGSVPVINALSDMSHPCQALADVMTIMDEFGPDLKGRTVTYVGDGNNVTRSLAAACVRLGAKFIMCGPDGYELPAADVEAVASGEFASLYHVERDPEEAVAEADAIYTDTWVSMGQEAEADRKRKAFYGYKIDEALVEKAPSHAIVLHCLPAYRNVEISDGVMDGPRSRVFPQAHNRLHAQKGLLAWMYQQ